MHGVEDFLLDIATIFIHTGAEIPPTWRQETSIARVVAALVAAVVRVLVPVLVRGAVALGVAKRIPIKKARRKYEKQGNAVKPLRSPATSSVFFLKLCAVETYLL